MSEKFSRHGEPTFFIIVLLTLAVASVVLIVIRLLYTITLSTPLPVLLGSCLFSMILMFLSGALLFQKPWSLFPLSLAGKGYFFLTLVLLLIRAENILDIAWLSTALGSFYLAIINYLNPLRGYAGRDRVPALFIARRAAVSVLFFSICITIYIVFISNLFPEYAYRIRPGDYGKMASASTAWDVPDDTWSERWKIAVPKGFSLLERDVGLGLWSNGQGGKIIVTPGVWSQQVEKSPFLGFTGPYKFEKAVWKAGIAQPFLLVLKKIMADEGTNAYLLEDRTVKSIIVTRHVELSSSSTWVASANIYPRDDQPYNIESTGGSLSQALKPIHMTLKRYLEGH